MVVPITFTPLADSSQHQLNVIQHIINTSADSKRHRETTAEKSRDALCYVTKFMKH